MMLASICDLFSSVFFWGIFSPVLKAASWERIHVNGTAAVKIFCAFDYYKPKSPKFGWALCKKCLLACCQHSIRPTSNFLRKKMVGKASRSCFVRSIYQSEVRSSVGHTLPKLFVYMLSCIPLSLAFNMDDIIGMDTYGCPTTVLIIIWL